MTERSTRPVLDYRDHLAARYQVAKAEAEAARLALEGFDAGIWADDIATRRATWAIAHAWEARQPAKVVGYTNDERAAGLPAIEDQEMTR